MAYLRRHLRPLVPPPPPPPLPPASSALSHAKTYMMATHGLLSPEVVSTVGYVFSSGAGAAALTQITKAFLLRNRDKEVELSARGIPIKINGHSARQTEKLLRLKQETSDRPDRPHHKPARGKKV
jgi:hypothetical protein